MRVVLAWVLARSGTSSVILAEEVSPSRWHKPADATVAAGGELVAQYPAVADAWVASPRVGLEL